MTDDPEFIAWRDGQKYHCDNCKSAFSAGEEAGRKAAIEECAKLADEGGFYCDAELCDVPQQIANSIRALLTEPSNG